MQGRENFNLSNINFPVPIRDSGWFIYFGSFANGYQNDTFDFTVTTDAAYADRFGAVDEFSENWYLDKSATSADTGVQTNTLPNLFSELQVYHLAASATGLSPDYAELEIEFLNSSGTPVYSLKTVENTGFSTELQTRIGTESYTTKPDGNDTVSVNATLTFDSSTNTVTAVCSGFGGDPERAVDDFVDNVPNIETITDIRYTGRTYCSDGGSLAYAYFKFDGAR